MTATEEAKEKEPVCAFNRYPIRELKVCLVGPTYHRMIFRINGAASQSVVPLDTYQLQLKEYASSSPHL